MNVNVSEHEEIEAWVIEGSKSALTLSVYAIGQWVWPNFQKNIDGIKSYDRWFHDIDTMENNQIVVSKEWREKLTLTVLLGVLNGYGVFATFNGAKKEAAECVPS